jgi:hypothetical protein
METMLCADMGTVILENVSTFVDTGAFNTMIDDALVDLVGYRLPLYIPISIGGYAGEAQGCILHRVILGNFAFESVFAMSFPFKDWLKDHIILGANVMNNWDFKISRSDNTMSISEKNPF